jgi:DNA-binding response OmpR family regulator
MTSSAPSLLLVDDDASITMTLSGFLELSGFEVHVASNGRQALDQIRHLRPDLIVLDVLMPELNGRDTLRQLRQQGDWTPVILLTQVSGKAERIMALEEGADDYLNKPFDPQELVVRIKAILRRTQASGPRLLSARRLVSGPLLLDRASRRVFLDMREIPLTPKAVSILEHLMLHPDELVTRERLLDAAWGWESAVGTRVIDTRVAELRKMLEDDATNPAFVETVPGQGYRFIGQVSTPEA